MRKRKNKKELKEVREKFDRERIDSTESERASEDIQNERSNVIPNLEDVELKIATLEKDIEDLKTELEDEREKRLRVLAEYDNFRRRTQGEFSRLIASANARLMMQMLPVLDDFVRFFDQNPQAMDNSSMIEGIALIFKKLHSALLTEGLETIEALDKPFDAELHEAIAQIADPSKPVGTIVSEVEKGYRIGEMIIRHAKVVVNREVEPESETTDE